MSQPIDMAVRITMTVLQSIETAVRRDILWYRVNRDTSGGIKLCHSLERKHLERHYSVTVDRDGC